MAVPAAPSNVFAQAGDSLVYLSWSNTATALSYIVQRSTDGVNFTTLASPTLNNYTDSSMQNNVAVNSTNLVIGNNYVISVLGTTTQAEWVTLGLSSLLTAAVGVSFVAAATGSGAGTGQVKVGAIQYFYQVAAVNGSGTGVYTTTDVTGAALSAIPCPMGIACLGNIRLQAQQRADRINSNFVTLSEWNKYISLSYKELYDILVQKYGDDYYVSLPYTYTTTGAIDPNYNASVYPLPSNFYKLLLVEVALNPSDPNSWVTLRQYERIQQNLWNFPNVYTFYGITNLRYRLTGTQLQIVPIPSGNQTLRIWYAPRPAILVYDTDTFDGISGYEEYVIIDAAIKALKKEESDCTELMAEKAAMIQRINSAAENRNVMEPQRVSDSRMRNFSWSDDCSWGGGGQW